MLGLPLGSTLYSLSELCNGPFAGALVVDDGPSKLYVDSNASWSQKSLLEIAPEVLRPCPRLPKGLDRLPIAPVVPKSMLPKPSDGQLGPSFAGLETMLALLQRSLVCESECGTWVNHPEVQRQATSDFESA